MTCLKCPHGTAVKAGTTNAHTQRFRCTACGARFTAPCQTPLGAHTTTLDNAVQVFTLLTEGMSVRAVSRVTGIHKTTILRLLQTVGATCARLFDARLRHLPSRRVQADEIWSYVGAKAKNATDEQKAAGWGDCWTWTAIDADTKLIVSYLVGSRGSSNCCDFMKDVAARLTSRVQLTTDGLTWYIDAVDSAFGIDVDFAMVTKHYGKGGAADASAATRYSPTTITSMTTDVITGTPDEGHISTSYVERQNLTMRMQMRRFTRLTNGFSKSKTHHAAMVHIYFMHYNFCRVHQTLRVTPAMEAGLTDHVWSIRELLTADVADERQAA